MDLARQLGSILVVFALLALALWAARRRGAPFRLPFQHSGSASRPIEALDRLHLTPQHTLHLVRIGGKNLLVATHPQGCQVLSDTSTHKGASA
jgi:flagellar biogenesis protein FliO